MTYQTTVIDGTEVPGVRDCSQRWDAIRAHITRKRFTVLDLGANWGYFSLRVAEIGGRVTAVDTWKHIMDPHPRVTWIRENATVDLLRDLGQFDYIFALSVLHHMADWEDALDTLVANARQGLFIEVPDPGEDPVKVRQCDGLYDAVVALGGEVIVETPGYRNDVNRKVWLIR